MKIPKSTSDWLFKKAWLIPKSTSDLLVEVRGQFRKQRKIDWFKKYKFENKTSIYGTVTYITVLLYYMEQLHT
jgi:hypothetical protein